MQSIDCVHSFSSTRTQYEAGEKKVASGILFFDNYIRPLNGLTHCLDLDLNGLLTRRNF